jgi:hypothetical protein
VRVSAKSSSHNKRKSKPKKSEVIVAESEEEDLESEDEEEEAEEEEEAVIVSKGAGASKKRKTGPLKEGLAAEKARKKTVKPPTKTKKSTKRMWRWRAVKRNRARRSWSADPAR